MSDLLPLREINSLAPSALIVMYEIDTAPFDGDSGQIYRFHGGLNPMKQPLVWAGNTYTPLGIQMEGLKSATSGQLPRPKFRVANLTGFMTGLVLDSNDLVGAKVTRIRTHARYLDASNFDGGNPTADPRVKYPDEVYLIAQKVAETRSMVEFELASPMDVFSIKLPGRRVLTAHCPWVYRGEECGYTGGPVATTFDQPTSDAAEDGCGKRIASCKLRFDPNNQNEPLPFGGFPGVRQ